MDSRRIIVCLGLGMLGGACSDFGERDPETGRSKAAVENGSANNDGATLGVPVIRTNAFSGPFTKSGRKKFCTGWMYDNEWLVTARHCFLDNDLNVVHGRGESGFTMGSQEVDGFDRIVTFAPRVRGTNKLTPDIAMLHLKQAIPVNGNLFHQRLPLTLTDAELRTHDGEDVTCMGYGGSSRGTCTPHTESPMVDNLLSGTLVFGYNSATNINDPARPFPDYVRLNPKPNSGGPGLTQVTLPGDSGGPCFFNSNLTDVFVTISVGLPCGSDPSFLNHVPAGRLEKLLAHIKQSKTALAADINFDNQPDVMGIGEDANGQAVAQLLLTNDLGDDNQVAAFEFEMPLGFSASSVDVPLGVLNDFDNDGFADLFGTFASNALYVLGSDLASSALSCVVNPASCALNTCINTPAACPISGLVPTYEEIKTADFNQDGFADVEAFPPACAAPDVWYGSSAGLTKSFAMNGFPTSEGDDGKFLTLAVQPTASIGVPDYMFRIRTTHPKGVTDPELHVEIFDGDMTGSHDTVVKNGQAVKTCYFLLPDPLQDGSGASSTVNIFKEDSAFTNNAWASMVDGSPPKEMPEALIQGSGPSLGSTYSYLLRIYQTTNPNCSDEPLVYPTDAVANAIKIRASGEVAFESSVDSVANSGGAISIRASDAVGPLAALDDCTPDTCDVLETQDIDTDYDGQWNFFIDLTQAASNPTGTVTEMWFSEADADSTKDPISPANSTGASPNINFVVTDQVMGAGNVFLSPLFPSGQFDPNVENCVTHVASGQPSGSALPTSLYWTWNEVPTHNNIWLAIPTAARLGACVDEPSAAAQALATSASLSAAGSGATLVPTFPLHGERPRATIPETTAATAAFWVSVDGRKQIGALLPITLGNPPSHGHTWENSTKVVATGQAVSILKRERKDDHLHNFEKTVVALQAELLAAKLNLARGLSHGEHISRGWIYGTTARVSDTIALADELLSSTCRGAGCLFEHHLKQCDDAHGNAFGHDKDQGKGNAAGHDHCVDDPKDRPSEADLKPVLTLLRAINSGQITYRAPLQVPTTLMAARTVSRSVAVTPGGSYFWRSY